MSNKIKIVGIAGIMVANIAYTTTYIAGIPQHSQTVTYQEHRMSGSYDLSLFPLDTVFSFKTKGTWPAGVAWDGAYLWLSDYDSLKIWKLDTLGNIISAFPNPAGATSFGCSGELAYDRANLWFVSEQSGKIFKLNPFNCSIVAVFNVPDYTSSDPNTFGVTWDGKYLWVSKYSTDAKIYKLRPSDGAPIDSFTPPNDGILAIEYLDGYIYGVDASGEKIYKMNPNNGTVVDSTEWPVPYAWE